MGLVNFLQAQPLLLGVLLVALVLVAQAWFRRLFGKRIQGANDVVGFYLGLLGALYGIALAFILAAAWDNQESTRELIDQEAQAVGAVAYIGRGLPSPIAETVVSGARTYAEIAVAAEWPSMARGKPSRELDQQSAALGLKILRFEPVTVKERELDSKLLDAFERLRTLRGERRLKAEYRVPPALWVLLVVGGCIILGLCFLLDVDRPWLHLYQTGLLATFIVMALLVTWDLQDPFQGFSNLTAEPFSRLLDDRYMDDHAWQDLVHSTASPSTGP